MLVLSVSLPQLQAPRQARALMYLYGRFACDVCNQEVHGNIFTVHVSIHPILDVSWHLVRVQIVEILEWKDIITPCHVDKLYTCNKVDTFYLRHASWVIKRLSIAELLWHKYVQKKQLLAFPECYISTRVSQFTLW